MAWPRRTTGRIYEQDGRREISEFQDLSQQVWLGQSF